MNRVIIRCSDGTPTIKSGEFGETYHSSSGSVEESLYVYITSGLLEYVSHSDAGQKEICILEAGFGSGLNAFLTLLESEYGLLRGRKILYTSLELYPLEREIWENLDFHTCGYITSRYLSYDTSEGERLFRKIHEAEWEREVRISERFHLKKIKADLSDTGYLEKTTGNGISAVYYDAFSPGSQPELWSTGIFRTLFGKMLPGGILTTYSSKGTVKSALREAGFEVRRLPGFAGKHHMVRATKPLPGTYFSLPDDGQAF